MVKASIVRLGPSDGESVSSKLLRTAVVSYSETSAPAPSTSAIDNKSGSTITIQNKYFSANVLLEDIGGQSLEQTKEDGVILVFDALRSNPDLMEGSTGASFDSLPLAHQQAEEKHSCGDLLRLCVGVSLASLSPEELRGKNHEKEYARRIMWCLDHGYEYVEADLSEDGQSKGHQDRDKEGFARIIEAIQGTVWSSAVMATAKTKELKASYNQESVALNGEEEEKSKEDKVVEEENPYEPPDPKKLGPWKTVEDAKESEDKQSTSIVDAILDPEQVGPEEMSKLRQDLEAEKKFDKMESVLQEAKRIREASVSGKMSDEERRVRAGDAALALVNLMGDMGFDDDDSEVDDSE
jgi:hypothetical protein